MRSKKKLPDSPYHTVFTIPKIHATGFFIFLLFNSPLNYVNLAVSFYPEVWVLQTYLTGHLIPWHGFQAGLSGEITWALFLSLSFSLALYLSFSWALSWSLSFSWALSWSLSFSWALSLSWALFYSAPLNCNALAECVVVPLIIGNGKRAEFREHKH